MKWLSIVGLSVLSCIFYGVLHDQVTARICVEYFTIGHPIIIESTSPTVLGIVWGVVATWWVGVILGVPLATVARVGTKPKFQASQLTVPIAILLAANGLFATLAGVVGYVAAVNGWVFLVGPIAKDLPKHLHVPFLVDLWAHSASYLGGLVGGISLMIWVWKTRKSNRVRWPVL